MNDEDFQRLPRVKPAIKYDELARIHQQRQCSILATLLLECPPTIPKYCQKLLQHAPESFDDLRFGTIAASISKLIRTKNHPTILTVQEDLLKSDTNVCNDLFQFISTNPQPLSETLLEFECEELWNAYNFRRQATLFNEAASALVATPHLSKHISDNVRRSIEELTRNGNSLPDIVDSFDFLSSTVENPPEIIGGILHQGSKLALGGGSKSFKTWTLLDLAISVSHGVEWMGFPTSKGRVLYINFEIQDYAWHNRIKAVADEKGVCLEPRQLQLWNLRGKSSDFNVILPKIIERTKAEGFVLIILDPIYKLYGKTDENKASDVAALMNGIEALNVETKSATAFGAHFAKGNASQKEAIDRISGSGVFARDPDSLLMFTPHEEPNCFTIEPILRNFSPVEPFTVTWRFPTMRRNDTLDPTRLRKQPGGRPKGYTLRKLLEFIKDTNAQNPISISDWSLGVGIPRTSLYGYVEELRVKRLIDTVGAGNSAKKHINQAGIDYLASNE